MIFLTAQPDEFYFTWQLEIQIYNFNLLGIIPENIHILIGYNPKIGISHYFEDIINKHQDKAKFFLYPDTRNKHSYAPSIRPHIIKKHIIANPWLQNECIFYHDADIIFRELPDFEKLQNDNLWYLSDTRDYTDSKYIKQNAGESTFKAMCNIVGIKPEIVSDQDKNCGGAQYLLKKTSPFFWEKVENDSEDLYELMNDHNDRQAELFNEKFGTKRWEFIGVQSWCADMWAVFWNGLLQGREIRIHPELDFVMAKSPIEKWYTCKILHYSGEDINAPGLVFRKQNYIHFPPYYDLKLEQGDYTKTSSFPLVNLIKQYRNYLNEKRIDLMDVTFLIIVRIDSESRLSNLYAIINYINKFFKTNILIGESDTDSKVDTSILPKCCKHLFFFDNNKLLHRTHVSNILIKKANSKIIAIYDCDVVFPIDQIVESVKNIRHNKADMVCPYSGNFIGVSNLFKTMFIKLLDPDLLVLSKAKHSVVSRRSYGGAAFLNKEKYIRAGMENEFFTSWGPEDIERPKRLKNLGYKIVRTRGDLYHLPHDRKHNSGYPHKDFYILFMEEYLKICNLSKTKLMKYIKTWPWTI
ncbi:galactosyltransferase-related protein [Rhizosphaericola mali]|uniref:Galactosyltransferase C-terminal domain-containing protein n=1 Tax=Rhizosphaericola mali TaxID=2545455 RepID=A0A5P2G631_9BACT|nr:galactosyltransferase-related protein [Rhizosphaericola mali]QES91045.1 hypothetical protein E0W69_020235 [Rhizosphaericola mali]